VQTYADCSDILNAKPIAFQSYAVAVAREQDRVKPVNTFKSRITRFLTGFDSSKEILESFIEASQRPLRAAEIKPLKIGVRFPLILKPTGLIFVAARDLPFIIEPLTLSQCGVVQATVRLEHDRDLALLVRVGPKTKLIRAEHHSLAFLAFNVAPNSGFTDVTNTAGIVTPGPKRREPTAQESKFLSQDTAGVTFETIGDFRDRNVGSHSRNK
jgi:hypothetical protein